MSTRQQRRRAERAAKKMVEYNMEAKLLQPWSAPVMATKLPDPVLG